MLLARHITKILLILLSLGSLIHCSPLPISSRATPDTSQIADNPAPNAYGPLTKQTKKQAILTAKQSKDVHNTKTRVSAITSTGYLKNTLSQFPGVRVYHRGDIVHIIMPADGIFSVDSHVMRKDGLSEMYQLTRVISAYNPSKIYITAYTDSVGGDKDKEILARKQAETVLGYLWAHGIPESTMIAIGYGKLPTVANNETSWGSRMNRRIEILFWSDIQPNGIV